MRTTIPLSLAVAGTLALAPQPARAAASEEAPAQEAYFRAVAEYFSLPAEEVFILGEWRISPEEVPVVLYLSRRAGVSADAVMALRRGGASWSALTERYGLGSDIYHVPLREGVDAGSLGRAYGLFRGRPSSEWRGIPLQDAEIVSLVNLRVLSGALDLEPERVLAVRDRTGSYVRALEELVRRGG